MTFSIKVKEEITKIDQDIISKRTELSAFLSIAATKEDNIIRVVLENASVARRIYSDIKEIFGINIKIIIRVQKRFRIKQIYILEIRDKIDYIYSSLEIGNTKNSLEKSRQYLDTKESIVNYIRGAFLASGSISDPATSGYHLEFVVPLRYEATFINSLLHELSLDSKVLKRSNKYMIYLKSAENISDLLKMFNAINSMFYFEDIRIYRDHKNMVNRLNNCEIANQEKTISAGLREVNDIEYLEMNDLIDLLDDKEKLTAKYRKMYPETSLTELANIISLETEKSITKSGINHHFRKIKELVNNHKSKK